MIILNDKQIRQKLRRLAFEIIEQNSEEENIIIAGINNNGYAFAKLLQTELRSIKDTKCQFTLANIKLNAANPIVDDVVVDLDPSKYEHSVVIVIDDVANTGRTLFYACIPFMEVLIKKLQTAVMINRTHKSYPVSVNFIGLSLATTLSDHINLDISNKENYVATVI